MEGDNAVTMPLYKMPYIYGAILSQLFLLWCKPFSFQTILKIRWMQRVYAMGVIGICAVMITPVVMAGDFTYTSNNHEITISGYIGSGGTVVVPNAINGLLVTSIEGNAFAACTNLRSITIPNGVVSIDSAVFDGCNSLVEVRLPDSVSNIGDHAFAYCVSLSNIVIPKNVVSIGLLPFEGCCSLRAITVDALNSAYSSVDGVLFDKKQTRLIQCPQGRTGYYKIPNSVTNIADYAFFRCVALRSIEADVSVDSIGDKAFFACFELTNVVFSGGVGAIGKSAFYFCTNLTSIITGVNNRITINGQL